MNKKILNLKRCFKISIVVLSILLTIALIPYTVINMTNYMSHNDSCHVIAMETKDILRINENATNIELNERIKMFIEASFIHGKVNKDNTPTDLNGNEYYILIDEKSIVVKTRIDFWQVIPSKWIELR